MKAPGFGDRRKAMLEDIAVFDRRSSDLGRFSPVDDYGYLPYGVYGHYHDGHHEFGHGFAHKDGNIGLRQQWGTAVNQCQDLIERLRAADPLVIDYFIDQNRHLEEIAKLCIAWVILEREFVSIRYGGNENRREMARGAVLAATITGIASCCINSHQDAPAAKRF